VPTIVPTTVASGASAAWLEATGWPRPAYRGLPPLRASITGFIERS